MILIITNFFKYQKQYPGICICAYKYRSLLSIELSIFSTDIHQPKPGKARERSSIEVEHGGSYFRFFIKSTCLLERGMYWRNSRKLRNFKFEQLF